MAITGGISTKKRLLFMLLIFTSVIILLILRVGWLQIINGEELQKKAYENQTQGNVLNPERGIIYDTKGEVLASSSSVETVTVDPNEVKASKKVKIEEVAKTLSDILQLDYEEVYKKVTKKSYYETLKTKIDKGMADKIRAAQLEGKLPGVRVIDDIKRTYPLGNFASNILGFTGSDNQGLIGLELKYDMYLRGTQGKLLFTKDGSGREIPYSEEKYITPKNGDNLYLTIDKTIQHYAEKALDVAVANNKVKRGTAIVMDPKTGEILALAVKPDYNLNKPFEVNDELIKETWDTLTSKEKNAIWFDMWKNPAITDTYEPGSTFKIITSASALEESVVKTTDMFTCAPVRVGGYNIGCWSTTSHGIETFVQGVQNSCNPVFIEVAKRMGKEKFYNYIKGFGFMEKTNVDLPGETSNTLFHKYSDIGPTELATYSFGQGFQVTPMQIIRAVSAVANDGKMMQPRIVKKIADADGKLVKKFDPVFVRQVISKDTSVLLRSILESVVSEGTGSQAYRRGYRIAGKTGTSEKLPRGSRKYVASFVGFAPANDPKVVVLVVLDEPQGIIYYGGQIAAPAVGDIIDETLSYLKVEPQFTDEENEDNVEITVPDLRNMSVSEAKKVLDNFGFAYKVDGTGNKVVEQLPKAGIKIFKTSPVYLFTSNNGQTSQKTVPNVLGKNISEANKILSDSNLGLKIIGSGKAVSQSPLAGEVADAGTPVEVLFSEEKEKE